MTKAIDREQFFLNFLCLTINILQGQTLLMSLLRHLLHTTADQVTIAFDPIPAPISSHIIQLFPNYLF